MLKLSTLNYGLSTFFGAPPSTRQDLAALDPLSPATIRPNVLGRPPLPILTTFLHSKISEASLFNP